MNVFTDRESRTDIERYYSLSKLMNDDVYKIAFLVFSCYQKRTQKMFYYILRDLEALKLKRYSDIFDELLTETDETLITRAQGITFYSYKTYQNYLCELLKLNNISFAPFVKTIETKSSFYNSIAFEYEDMTDES